jgi:hypothetical protein
MLKQNECDAVMVGGALWAIPGYFGHFDLLAGALPGTAPLATLRPHPETGIWNCTGGAQADGLSQASVLVHQRPPSGRLREAMGKMRTVRDVCELESISDCWNESNRNNDLTFERRIGIKNQRKKDHCVKFFIKEEGSVE